LSSGGIKTRYNSMMVIWANRKTHHKIHIGREEKF
jgi:hypothetical protein